MGRLTDAMRRAAEGSEGTPTTSTTTPAGLADDRFPAEAPRDEGAAAGSWADLDLEAPGTGDRVPDGAFAPDQGPSAPDDRGPLLGGGAGQSDGAPAPGAAVRVGDAQPAAAGGDPRGPVGGSLFDRVDMRYSRKVVVDQDMAPASREQYRRLAAALHHAQGATGIKVVMIASAVPSEGKTLTASNLALTLSESYQRNVLLIDADLRKPSLHAMFKLAGTPGLSEGLSSSTQARLPLRQISSRLTLLTAGAPSPDPMAGLTSERMRRLIDEARESFDWIVIDTSPIGLLTDASLLATMVDAVLMVVRAASTPHDLVRRAVDAVGPERIIGVVLNQADLKDQPYGSAYQYGYPGYPSSAETASPKRP